MELTGIKLRLIVKNVRLSVQHAQILQRHVRFANQTSKKLKKCVQLPQQQLEPRWRLPSVRL